MMKGLPEAVQLFRAERDRSCRAVGAAGLVTCGE